MKHVQGGQSVPRRIDEIENYHAHVYFDGPAERERMTMLRSRLGERFHVQIVDPIEEPVGVHPKPMLVVAFTPELFGTLVPWLMLNRFGLSILVHPNTDDALRDHVSQAAWLGAALEFKANDELPESMQPRPSLKVLGRSQPPVVVNTAPTISNDI